MVSVPPWGSCSRVQRILCPTPRTFLFIIVERQGAIVSIDGIRFICRCCGIFVIQIPGIACTAVNVSVGNIHMAGIVLST